MNIMKITDPFRLFLKSLRSKKGYSIRSEEGEALQLWGKEGYSLRLKERADFIGEEAERWKERHADVIARLPAGTTVIVDITSGEFVMGEDWHEARDAFERRFGGGEHLSHSFTIDRPIFLGGGLWRNWSAPLTNAVAQRSGSKHPMRVCLSSSMPASTAT